MTTLPTVSVVIPCLNRAHFLVPTIESVLKQDYPAVECIVVDGGSTDGTLEILERYKSSLTWVSEPDKGHADAINKGWKMSRGDILAWLNADDVWVAPSAVSQAVAHFQAHPETDVVYGNCGSIDMDGNLVGMSYLHEWDLEYAVEYCDHCIPQPAAFIRRRILEAVKWLDTNFYQKKDHELWLRIGLVGHIRHIPVLLAHARNQEGLSFDGVTAAPACVQVTQKFFTLPSVPPSLRAKQRRALSNAYLRGIDYAWVGGRHWSIIFSYTLRAIIADPSNTHRALKYLKDYAERSAPDDGRFRWFLVALALLNAPRRIVLEVRSIFNFFQPVSSQQDTPVVRNLLGDRDIEWSWIASQMPSGPGEALDFGSGGSHLALIASQRGFNVTAVDLEPICWPYVHPQLRFVRGEILKLSLPKAHFDLVINCSTVEHVGLVGRYGVTENRPDGDLDAMGRLRKLMKPGGIMLLTVPVGQDTVFAPLCRVYGRQRLPRLLQGYTVEKETYWVKDDLNRWVISDKETALNFNASAGSWDALQNVYALGCFVLRRDEGRAHGAV